MCAEWFMAAFTLTVQKRHILLRIAFALLFTTHIRKLVMIRALDMTA